MSKIRNLGRNYPFNLAKTKGAKLLFCIFFIILVIEIGSAYSPTWLGVYMQTDSLHQALRGNLSEIGFFKVRFDDFDRWYRSYDATYGHYKNMNFFAIFYSSLVLWMLVFVFSIKTIWVLQFNWGAKSAQRNASEKRLKFLTFAFMTSIILAYLLCQIFALETFLDNFFIGSPTPFAMAVRLLMLTLLALSYADVSSSIVLETKK